MTLPSWSSKRWSEGEPVPFTLYQELPCLGAGKTTAPATRVALATSAVPPLGIFCSVSDKNLSESVASSRSLCFHWELQFRDVSDQPSWIILPKSLFHSLLLRRAQAGTPVKKQNISSISEVYLCFLPMTIPFFLSKDNHYSDILEIP